MDGDRFNGQTACYVGVCRGLVSCAHGIKPFLLFDPSSEVVNGETTLITMIIIIAIQ